MIIYILSGTCINNTSVMMFKKGSFEVDTTIYPVAIKVKYMCLTFNWLEEFRINLCGPILIILYIIDNLI